MRIKNKLYFINLTVLLLVLIVCYINPLERKIDMKYLSITFITAMFFGSFFKQFFKDELNKNALIIFSGNIISFVIIGFMVASYILNVSFLFD